MASSVDTQAVAGAPRPTLSSLRALYSSADYAAARAAAQAILETTSSTPSPLRHSLSNFTRACDRNLALLSSAPATGDAASFRAAYLARLRALQDAARLQPVADQGTQECVIVRRPGDPESRDDFQDSECPSFDAPHHWWAHHVNREVSGAVLDGFPMDQMTAGFLYLKTGVIPLRCSRFMPSRKWDDTEEESESEESESEDSEAGGGRPGASSARRPCWECRGEKLPDAVYEFPCWCIFGVGNISSRGGQYLDVQVARGVLPEATRVQLIRRLQGLRVIRPARYYETCIDPNVGAVNGLWVPTIFHTYQAPVRKAAAVLQAAFRSTTGGQVMLWHVVKRVMELCGADQPSEGRCVIHSRVPDLDPHRHGNLYTLLEDVFQCSLHLLARLRLPALLLPGPLQVVVKAQSIVLDGGDTYEGVWHEDGLREHVVAVVLFYYNVSPEIAGGALEFTSKHSACWGKGIGPGYR